MRAENVDAAEERLTLAALVRQALAVNLDLAAERDALAARREDVDIARSPLLPQLRIGANAQHLEDDRSGDNRGNYSQRSATVEAEASQLIYDENAWAGYRIQEHVYAGQEFDFESFRIGIIQRAAITFLNLNLSRTVAEIQEENRELTRKNVETTRARVATGYSSEREVLRWESQLSGNDQDVRNARAQSFVDLFELNAVRNRPLETAVELVPAAEDRYGFLYGRDEVVRAIQDSQLDRKFRDAVVSFGLERSPILASINESIEAEKRRLVANRRTFWIPTVTLDGGVNHLAADDAKSDDEDFDETEWRVGVGLTLPLFTGGSRIAELRQTTEQLSSFRIQYGANALTISQGIRSALAQSSAAFLNVDSARAQREDARKNFELVDQSYVSGVATILTLLDAQAQLLNAELALANAQYAFFTALVSLQQQIAFYPFLEPEAEVQRLLDELVADIRY